ncbi:MAG TPA: SusE domain-containing protein, partial [Flavobacterium sp.]|nr:SusE domain-containing protein [Flavobacterium sp.]
MKNILKTIIFAFALIAFGSCEHDADPIVSANGFTLRTAESLSPVVLIPQNDANTVATLQWDKSDNGGFTSVSQYKVEVAESGTNFAAAIT